MKRLLLLFALLTAAWAGPARAADGIPARPKPFTFVTDQAGLLQPADAKRLDNGLRRYADNTGTQVVVVTVPSLNGQNVSAVARQIGTEWGVGQQGKNNGLVVLVAKQEHKLSIEPGSGLRATITPAVIQQVIGEMTPQFKQNDYAGGLRQGLNTLMVTANPSSAPKAAATAQTPATSGSLSNGASLGTTTTPAAAQAMEDPAGSTQSAEAPATTSFPWGTILLGAVIVIGGIWLVAKLFRRNSNTASNGPGGSPNFYPNQQPTQPNQPNQPNFYPNQGPANYGAPAQSGGGMGGMGGILATGAAAAAGAYLGNRLGGSHESGDSGRNFSNDSQGGHAGTAAGAAGGTAAADDYFSSQGGNANTSSSPDYFSDNSSSDSSGSGDYFSGNDTSYDDSSGGGGFDDTNNNDNSGSW